MARSGRFSGEMSEIVERFNASIDFDRRLYREDIAGSIAHARMLARRGIIPAEDAEAKAQANLEKTKTTTESAFQRADQAREDYVAALNEYEKPLAEIRAIATFVFDAGTMTSG